MAFKMLEIGCKISVDDIRQLELVLNMTLPDEYKEFLYKYNGGRPDPAAFNIHGFPNNPKGVIQEFMGVRQPILSSNIAWTFKAYHGRIPHHLLPIARTGTGDLVCLDVGATGSRVVFWDSQSEESPPSCRNVYRVADSFQEFICGIHEYDPLESLCLDPIDEKGAGLRKLGR